jgi:hypothetical protein
MTKVMQAGTIAPWGRADARCLQHRFERALNRRIRQRQTTTPHEYMVIADTGFLAAY